ncbi:hypothetical protein CONPUDRAFT_139811 [Coniophora puteana RWD-64-598 SS2]|uniref:C2H2-type domain-containing protein n=1 Tax=Coniophora puteana (strain RWD-64-598) TaxID=741705 RepID=A0A5M3MAG3_CONPW|nr:uncharacterized protein CONPUDRAFT_139811 [Coniophora puteana RWD-64-598 SS2]EIW75770.1 hypothetical protein CONPUDRAFT_139811 [Coniophora puteana RWD-64-598 SS2]
MAHTQDQDAASLSLLSLSIAASEAAPIALDPTQPTGGNDTTARPPASSPHMPKHRRLSSAGRARRRLSDARDAATRPSPAALQAAASALTSLSLSSSPPSSVPHTHSFSQSYSGESNAGIAIPGREDSAMPDVGEDELPTSSSVGTSKGGKKRGTIFTCESCSKIYRHPSCLIKHRWEHTPQWREASKFVLSKHQQVQLLEAAAILSHLSPSSGSLPEDRSLWPSFISNGAVPPPAGAPSSAATPKGASHPVSSSVPANSPLYARGGSAGPRMHDYALPQRSTRREVRPGVFGVSNDEADVDGPSSTSAPLPVPIVGSRADWGLPASFGGVAPSSQSYSYSRSYSASLSLTHSSLHSGSRSRSVSGSRSDVEEPIEDVDADVDLEGQDGPKVYPYPYGTRSRTQYGRYPWKVEEEDVHIQEEDEVVDVDMARVSKEREVPGEWDGMEMEMDMD